MELTEDEIAARIAAGEIGAVSLDTSIFVVHGLKLEGGMLAQLRTLVAAKLPLLLSDIVTRELQRHVLTATKTSLQRTRRGIAELRVSLAAPDPSLDQALQVAESCDPATLTEQRILRFVAATSATVLETVNTANLADVLRRYFAGEAPFGEGAKRKEFPDAFALSTLEHWAETHNSLVLVISTDGDWRRYCVASSRLVCFTKLDRVLAWAQAKIEQAKLASDAEQRLIEYLYEEPPGRHLLDALQILLDEQSYELRVDAEVDAGGFFAAPDLVVDEVNIDKDAIQYDGFVGRLIGYSPDELTIVLTLPCKLNISGVVVFSMTDPIDKDQLAMGSDSAAATVEQTLDVVARFAPTGESDWKLLGAELEPAHIHVDLGHMTPDWLTGEDRES